MGSKVFSLFRYLLPLSLLLVAAPLKSIGAETIQKKAEQPVQVTLLAEDKSIQPGHPFWVGVELKMAEGWDTYWINPGDAGFPTKVDWQLPQGFQAGPLLWPYPERFTSQSLVGYGYTHSVVLLTQITPPKDFSSHDNVSLLANVSWLACKEQCIPGNAQVSLALPITAHPPETNAAAAGQFAQARQLVPKSLSEKEGAVTLAAQAEHILVHFKPAATSFGEVVEALFIPEQGEVIDHGAPQSLIRADSGYTLKVKRAHPEQSPPSQVKGVLLVSEKGSDIKKAIQVDSSFDTSSPIVTPPSTTDRVSSLWLALGFAFLGGLILNVMPCVLPVIALKIFGFVKMANQRRSEIMKHGGIFALGVVLSFWILSGILLVLRAYGEGIGWGFQLQEPIFVVILASVLFLLGLSLFGVFELGTSLISLGSKTASNSSPLKSSFMSGVLATLVATPCTGPLLGPALGFAMTLPTLMAMSVFTAMGLGMAFPYLLFSAFPKLVRFLPKPGNWMIVFKQLMGFLMMGTVVWLIWVFGAQTDHLAVFVLLGCLLVIAFGAWIFGKWATPSRRKMTRMIALCLSFAIFFAGATGAIGIAKHQRTSTLIPPSQEGEEWVTYSPEKVALLRSQGKSVFIDFTAKWCLICQANKVVLHSSEVEKAFKEKGVVTMIADWTKRDAVITDELQKLGRTGVPVYVLYPADNQQAPYILPQTLTSGVVTNYLEKLNRTTVHAD